MSLWPANWTSFSTSLERGGQLFAAIATGHDQIVVSTLECFRGRSDRLASSRGHDHGFYLVTQGCLSGSDEGGFCVVLSRCLRANRLCFRLFATVFQGVTGDLACDTPLPPNH